MEQQFLKAKELFDTYDGSTFYMSRDGVEEKFLSYRVPQHISNKWLNELTAQKLEILDSPGNWKVVHFLIHHSDFNYLEDILQIVPRGVLWEKCAFLETLLKYGKNGNFNIKDRKRIREYVRYWANALLNDSELLGEKDRPKSIINSLESYV